MTRNKTILFFSSLTLIFGFLSYKYLFQQETKPLTNEHRNSSENTATEIKLEAGKSYIVDNKKFKQGFYDITCLDGIVNINDINMSAKDRYLGVPFYYKNKISIEGKGTLLLSPAKFEIESQPKNTYTLNNTSAIYQAGEEIKEGIYNLEVINNKNTPFYIFVTINNYDDSQTLQSFDIKKTKNNINFPIKKGEFIKLLNLSNPDTDIEIKLTKTS